MENAFLVRELLFHLKQYSSYGVLHLSRSYCGFLDSINLMSIHCPIMRPVRRCQQFIVVFTWLRGVKYFLKREDLQ